MMRKYHECNICDVTMISGFRDRHISSKSHKDNLVINEKFIGDI